MTTKHTPGPWSIGGQLINGAREPHPNPKAIPTSKVVAECRWNWGGDKGATEPRIDLDEMTANARLIAAAPELLDQLKHALRFWDQLTQADAERYRAAIAKAEGRK